MWDYNHVKWEPSWEIWGLQPAPNKQLILGHVSYLSLLGFQEGKAAESSQYDLVFLHVGAAELESLVGVISQIEGT